MTKRKRLINADIGHNWQALKPGDIIDIIAPASSVTTQDLKRAQKFVRRLGFRPRVQSGILGKDKIFASPDFNRGHQLCHALKQTDSKAIWCLRGGYGSLRLLRTLSRLNPPKHSKVLLGFSDITTLHIYLNLFWRWPTLHSANLDRISRGQDSKSDLVELQKVLLGKKSQLAYSQLVPLNKLAKKKRTINGALVGGNMSVFSSAVGTPWAPFAEGKILFFEEVNEKFHRLDRMLMQMQLAGCFKGVRALVFGDITIEDRQQQRWIWDEVIRRFAQKAKFPVLKGLPCGHGKRQRVLPLLTTAHLELSARQAKLTVASGCG